MALKFNPPRVDTFEELGHKQITVCLIGVHCGC